ncbi:MAG: hypothetical protein ACT4OS_05125 [Acidimicrobiales bacterium]
MARSRPCNGSSLSYRRGDLQRLSTNVPGTSFTTRLETVLGPESATTLMEHLPSVGWSDVATKRDLDALEAHMRVGMADLRTDLIEKMSAQTRTMIVALGTVVLAMASIGLVR